MFWTSIQRRLGVIADGNPGPVTYKALLDRIVVANTDPAFGQSLSAHGAAYAITTAPRLAEFIAECAHESGGFTHLAENLTYTSADRIRAIWPSRFPTDASAALCVRNPEKLANTVYGQRMGNTGAGDGYAYRGRGIIMLTGKANYALYGPMIGVDLVASPDRASDPATAMSLALAYWNKGGLNALIDAGDWSGARKRINGGTIGLNDVAAIRGNALALLS